MKVINFEKFIVDFNRISKRYEGIDYNELLKLYKNYLKRSYKIRQHKNRNRYFTDYMINELLVDERINIRVDSPTIKDAPISFILRNVRVLQPDDIKYNIIKTLGEGAWGKVFKVEIDDKIYALKEQMLNNQQERQVFSNEIEYMKTLNKIKPKIAPKYYDSWIQDRKGYILIEYINCGTLAEYSRTHKLTASDMKEIKRIITLLHKNGLIHMDLHDSNILVECVKGKKKRFYLSDFGISETIKNQSDQDFWQFNYKYQQSESEKQYIYKILYKATPEDMVQNLVVDEIIQKNLLHLSEK